MSYTASYIVNSSSAQGVTDFTFTFPYIKEDHIEVYLNYNKINQGTASAEYQVITNVSPKLIRLNTGLASANLRVEVRRNSSLGSPLVDYADGSTLTANDLDTSALQSLYIDQELKDNQSRTVSVDEDTGLPSLGESGTNLRVTKVGDPVSAQDAATKNYVDTTAEPKSAKLTELATMGQTTANALAELTEAEVQAIDGLTASTDELNKLDGVTATTAELNYVDGVTSNVQTQLDAKQPLDTELTELATMGSTTASALADLTQAEVQILDGATVSTDELNKLDGVTATTTELNHVDGVTSNVQTQLDAKQPLDTELTELATMSSGTASALADLTQAEVETLDGLTATTAELNKLDGVTATTAELNKTDGLTSTPVELNTLDGITSNTSELNKLDGVTASTTELNIVSGKSFKTSSGTLDTTSDTEIPSSKVIAAHVASSQTAIGGFTTIADEVSFPNTQPATGVVVSINNAAGVVVNGSGVSTTGRRLDNTTVTINGFPSSLNGETLAAGVGLIVVTTSTANTYNYHKILTSETDVKQLSDDINDFNSRYRIASSAPGSNNDEGDLYFDTAANKMKVYNGSAWDDVASVGSFFITTLSAGSGTGSNTSGNFDGSSWVFALSSPPTFAGQLIVSINGVIQKPNSGTSRPSEGFAVNGNNIVFCDPPPATGSDYFIVTCGSSVSIGTPSANSVNSSHIIDGSIVDGDVSSTANIAGSKVADDSIAEVKLDVHNAPATGKYLKYTSNGMEWDDVPAGVGGATGVDFNDDVKARFGTGNDLEIFHSNSGTTNYIASTAAGGLDIRNTGGGNTFLRGDTLYVANGAGSSTHIKATNGGAVEVYYGGNKKLETTNTGVTVTGTLAATAVTGDGSGLTNLPAGGNTFTAVANGSIANNRAVKLDTDGRVSQIKNETTVLSTPEFQGLEGMGQGQQDEKGSFIHYYKDGASQRAIIFQFDGNGYDLEGRIASMNSSGFFNANSTSSIDPDNPQSFCGAYDSNVNRAICFYTEDGGSNYIKHRVASHSGTTLTWGSETNNDTTYTHGRWMKAVFDETENRGVLMWLDNSSNSNRKLRYRIFYGNSGATTLVLGSVVEMPLFGGTGIIKAEDNTMILLGNSRILVSGRREDGGGTDNECWVRLGTINGGSNSITWGATGSAISSGVMEYNSTYSYDESSGKVIQISRLNAGSGEKWYSRCGTISGSGSSLAISWSSRVLLQDNNDYRSNNLSKMITVYESTLGKVVALLPNSDTSTLQYRVATVTGSSVSWSTAVSITSGVTNGNTYTWQQAQQADDGKIIAFGNFNNSGYKGAIRQFTLAQIQSTIRSKAGLYVGFADQAYTNGQTATIVTNGNVATTLSGLTTATKYYVQGDGTLASTADPAEGTVHGGLALASNRLQIQVYENY